MCMSQLSINLKQPIRYTMLGAVGLAFLASLALSKHYWGYFFKRPGLLNDAKKITRVERVIAVNAASCIAPERCEFIVDRSRTLAQSLEYARKSTHNALEERNLIYFQAKGLLPDNFSLNLNGAPDLYAPLMKTPIIAEPDPGYTNAHQLRGIVIIGFTDLGERRAVVGARGHQLSNDHYPFYEAVFKIEPTGEAVTYLSGQRFFFDIAGLEGLEWYIMWPFLTVLAVAVVFPIAGVGAVIVYAVSKRCQMGQ